MPTVTQDGFEYFPGFSDEFDFATLVDGSTTTGVVPNNYADASGKWIQFDFGDAAVKVSGLRWQQGGGFGAVNSAGVFQVQGSNDGGTNWHDIGDTIELGVPLYDQTYPLATDSYYNLLRLLGVSGHLVQPSTYLSSWVEATWQVDASKPADKVYDDGTPIPTNPLEGLDMSDLATAVGDDLLKWFKGTAMSDPPDAVYAALFDGDPDDDYGTELTGANGLTRQAVTFGDVTDRYILNSSDITFGIATADITVAAFCLFDAATGGTRLTQRVLDASVSIESGEAVVIRSGKLPLYY